MTNRQIRAVPLTQESFAAFGTVVQYSNTSNVDANQGTAKRSQHLAKLANSRPSLAVPNVSVYKCSPQSVVDLFTIKLLERHPFSTQMFIPTTKSQSSSSYLVIVAKDSTDSNKPDLSSVVAFTATSLQSINYNTGTWHHPILCFGDGIDFVCVAWEAGAMCVTMTDDCQEFHLQPSDYIDVNSAPVIIDILSQYETFVDLATSANGGKIIFATDSFFAPASNMLSQSAPVFDETTYSVQGKLMDGWETRRKRIEGHDWCIVKLGLPGIIHGTDFDTAFFTGNQTPVVSIQAAYFPTGIENMEPFVGIQGTCVSPQQIARVEELIESRKWTTILEKQSLKPGSGRTNCRIPSDSSQYFSCELTM